MKLINIENNNFLGIYEKAINNKFNFEDKIKIAKLAGFDFLEISIDESDERLSRLDWSEEQIFTLKKMLMKYSFKINSMCLSGHRKYPFGSAVPEIREQAKIIMKKALWFADKLGIKIIQLAGYDVYYEDSTDASKEYFLEGIKWATKEAEKYSIILAFEIMDTKFMGTISNALKYLDYIKSPYLQIYPDLGNITQWTNDLENEFEKGKNNIVGIHFKDTKNKVFKCIKFGEGDVDFKRCLKILEKINYVGPILIEMWSDNDLTETLEENIEKLKEAKNFYLEQWKF